MSNSEKIPVKSYFLFLIRRLETFLFTAIPLESFEHPYWKQRVTNCLYQKRHSSICHVDILEFLVCERVSIRTPLLQHVQETLCKVLTIKGTKFKGWGLGWGRCTSCLIFHLIFCQSRFFSLVQQRKLVPSWERDRTLLHSCTRKRSKRFKAWRRNRCQLWIPNRSCCVTIFASSAIRGTLSPCHTFQYGIHHP